MATKPTDARIKLTRDVVKCTKPTDVRATKYRSRRRGYLSRRSRSKLPKASEEANGENHLHVGRRIHYT